MFLALNLVRTHILAYLFSQLICNENGFGFSAEKLRCRGFTHFNIGNFQALMRGDCVKHKFEKAFFLAFTSLKDLGDRGQA
jgi:hypothetical protein